MPPPSHKASLGKNDTRGFRHSLARSCLTPHLTTEITNPDLRPTIALSLLKSFEGKVKYRPNLSIFPYERDSEGRNGVIVSNLISFAVIAGA